MGELIADLTKHYVVHVIAAVIVLVLAGMRHLIAIAVTSIFSMIKVYGSWETYLKQDGVDPTRHEHATLHQFIHKIWGRAIAANGTRYQLRGSIVGDRIHLIYRATNVGFDCGAIVLQIMANGREMKGYEVGIDIETNQFYSREYEWKKIN